MIIYLNNQIKQMYHITDEDYLNWCDEHDKNRSYKSTMTEFLYKIRTKRLVKDANGKLITKRPRRK